MRGPSLAQSAIEPGQDILISGFIGPFLSRRRHLPGAQLPGDLLPFVGVASDGGGAKTFQIQFPFLQLLAVAISAILLHDRSNGKRVLWPFGAFGSSLSERHEGSHPQEKTEPHRKHCSKTTSLWH